MSRPGPLPVAVVLGLLLTLGLGLRLWALGGQSFWIDEVLSVRAAEQVLNEGPVSRLLDRHGPLFTYFLACAVALGPGEFAARLPSVLFGVGLIWVAWLLGREFLSPREGMCAAAVAAVSPLAVWYSQEARYVSLFLLLSALSLLLSRRLLENGRPRDMLGYLLSTLAMLFCFVGGVFLVVAQNVCVPWARPTRRVLIRWAVIQVLVLLTFVPWLFRAYGLGPQPPDDPAAREFSVGELKSGTRRPLGAHHGGYALYTFGVGFTLGPSVRELHHDLSLKSALRYSHEVAPAVVVVGALLLAGLASLRGVARARALLLLLGLIIPIAGAYAMASITDLSFNVRYAAGGFPAFVVLAAAGASWFERRGRAGRSAVAAFVLVAAVSLAHYYFDPAHARDDNRAAARLLTQRRLSEEPLVVGREWRALEHYYSVPFLRWTRVRVGTRDQVPADLPLLPAPRVWIGATRAWTEPAFDAFLKRMHTCFELEERHAFPGFEVMSFRIDQPRGDPRCVIAGTL